MDKFTKIIAEGLESLKTIKADKAEYRAHLARIEALPQDYKLVYSKITAYMWSLSGGGDGYDMLKLQADLVELFESGASSSKGVLEITGDDVAAFADELLKSVKTYAENCREKLNREIHEKIGK
ncbi:MAG: DUF1048 domain-containing protein [Oscillospiraceae bacterium]